VAVNCVVDGVAVVVVVVVEVACGFNALVRLQGFFVSCVQGCSGGTVGKLEFRIQP
jgi:hypothetical protein